MYFYADRTDRAGNRLLTSYGKQAQATKYGGASAKIFQGDKYLNVAEDGTASLGNEGELLLRTLMVRPEGESAAPSGKFVVYARVDGKWERTSFRYATYSLANSAVKSALINLYEACAVVEDEAAEGVAAVPQNLDDEIPL